MFQKEPVNSRDVSRMSMEVNNGASNRTFASNSRFETERAALFGSMLFSLSKSLIWSVSELNHAVLFGNWQQIRAAADTIASKVQNIEETHKHFLYTINFVNSFRKN